MRPLFPTPGALKLLFTDTDSLAYSVGTDDFFAAMSTRPEEFDFSNLPPEHPSYSLVNKMVPGKMKDDNAGCTMVEFVGHRAKAYSYLKMVDGKIENAKRLKGISKCVVKNEISHEDYRNTLMNQKILMASIPAIRSKSHMLYTIEQSKKALAFYDDKRYILPDNIHTLPHGHYATL